MILLTVFVSADCKGCAHTLADAVEIHDTGMHLVLANILWDEAAADLDKNVDSFIGGTEPESEIALARVYGRVADIVSVWFFAPYFFAGGGLFFFGVNNDTRGVWDPLFDADGAGFEYGLLGGRIPLFLSEFVGGWCSVFGLRNNQSGRGWLFDLWLLVWF